MCCVQVIFATPERPRNSVNAGLRPYYVVHQINSIENNLYPYLQVCFFIKERFLWVITCRTTTLTEIPLKKKPSLFMHSLTLPAQNPPHSFNPNICPFYPQLPSSLCLQISQCQVQPPHLCYPGQQRKQTKWKWTGKHGSKHRLFGVWTFFRMLLIFHGRSGLVVCLSQKREIITNLLYMNGTIRTCAKYVNKREHECDWCSHIWG